MLSLEELTDRAGERDWLLPPEAAVPHFPAVALDAAGALALRQGRTITTTIGATPGTVRLRDEHGGFMGLGERDAAGRIKVRRLFSTTQA
jgi:hypothetical protein